MLFRSPVQTGTSYTLSPILQPLAAVQSEVLVLTGLDKANSRPGEAHLASTANFLTGMSVRATTGRDIGVGGVSLDQHLAKSFVGKTLVPSLVLSCEPVRTGVDRIVNWTLLYSSLISWETPERPVMPETNPRSAFESLFNLDSAGARGAVGNRRLLDLVLEDARGLRPRLGRDDRTRLDQYLDSVETVENRVRFIESETERRASTSQWKPSEHDRERFFQRVPVTYCDRVKLMLDLLVLAFRGDATRVVSMMLANDATIQTFEFIGEIGRAHV